jgi:hypothetical protein
MVVHTREISLSVASFLAVGRHLLQGTDSRVIHAFIQGRNLTDVQRLAVTKASKHQEIYRNT